MEYSVNGNGNGNGRWVDYDPKNPPKFEGNQNVFVRHKGEMNLEDGLSKKVTFKNNVRKQSVDSINALFAYINVSGNNNIVPLKSQEHVPI